MSHFKKPILIPIVLSLIILIIASMESSGRDLFKYFGPLTGDQGGMSYRWVTGHFTHLGWSHTGLNLIGLSLIWWAYGRQISNAIWLIFIVICPLGISWGLDALSSDVGYYVGLSGVLHGMFALAITSALLKFLFGNPFSLGKAFCWEDAILFFGLWGKIIYEQTLGAVPMTAALAGDSVVIDAHLFGALLGTVFAFLIQIMSRSGLKT